MFHLKLDSESGMAMVIALVVTMLGLILTGSYMGVVIFESKHSVWQKQRIQTLFLAESGIEKGLYYLNNTDDPDNPWIDAEGQILNAPLTYEGTLTEGRYEVILYDQTDMPFLPARAYLAKSVGIISRRNSKDIERSVSCVVANLGDLPIPAALTIFDDSDPEDELLSFESSAWTIDGNDIDMVDPFGEKGIWGIAVANAEDDVDIQLGDRLDQIAGVDDSGGEVEGAGAILEDGDLPHDLEAYANYFKDIARSA